MFSNSMSNGVVNIHPGLCQNTEGVAVQNGQSLMIKKLGTQLIIWTQIMIPAQ